VSRQEEDAPAEEGTQSVRVEIFGEEYVIRTDMDEEYTRRCAEFVDEAIRDAHLDLHVSEPHKAAILAALHITDRYFRLRKEKEREQDAIHMRLNELRSRISSAVEDSSPEPEGD
jgi:cell division protein ZapA